MRIQSGRTQGSGGGVDLRIGSGCGHLDHRRRRAAKLRSDHGAGRVTCIERGCVSTTEQAFGFLRQFVRRQDPGETCEMCSAPLGDQHQHLLEPATRKLVCSCDACAILFSNQTAKRFKRVPRRVRVLDDFQLTDGQWDSLMMPINMAFFFESTPQGRVMALYPSPAGATESLLPLDAWEEIAAEHPAVRGMQP